MEGEILRLCDAFIAINIQPHDTASSIQFKFSFICLLIQSLQRLSTIVIHPVHMKCFELVYPLCTYKQIQDLIKLGLFNVLASSFKQNGLSQIQFSLTILEFVTKESSKQEKIGKKNLHLDIIEQQGIVTRLIELIVHNELNLSNYYIDLATLSLGYIYKALQLPGELGKIIVPRLKLIIASKPQTRTMTNALMALLWLSEHEQNYKIIAASSFFEKITWIIRIQDKMCEDVHHSIMILGNILSNTPEGEKRRIISLIPRDKLQDLVKASGDLSRHFTRVLHDLIG
ncbi:MAG: hypothetical protein EZS28_010451 [Streblomastix strix]|uniref:Uncharacterized protein n=1 Tax=Streblomastix strix TaxID=222440 RepID=A0A5J4WH52_9EUKA|nr:MAG: hypothetical protein EZS28_010451 [Streblomastix strix]